MPTLPHALLGTKGQQPQADPTGSQTPTPKLGNSAQPRTEKDQGSYPPPPASPTPPHSRHRYHTFPFLSPHSPELGRGRACAGKPPTHDLPPSPQSADLCIHRPLTHSEEPASPHCLSGSHLHGNTHCPRTGPLCSANQRPVPCSPAAHLGGGHPRTCLGQDSALTQAPASSPADRSDNVCRCLAAARTGVCACVGAGVESVKCSSG